MNPVSWIAPAEAREALATRRGSGVRVAVIDSGIETAHPALEGARVEDDLAIVQKDDGLVVEPGGGTDLFGHGTAVAWCLLQNAPEAAIGSFRVLDARNTAKSQAVCRAEFAVGQGQPGQQRAQRDVAAGVQDGRGRPGPPQAQPGPPDALPAEAVDKGVRERRDERLDALDQGVQARVGGHRARAVQRQRRIDESHLG